MGIKGSMKKKEKKNKTAINFLKQVWFSTKSQLIPFNQILLSRFSQMYSWLGLK